MGTNKKTKMPVKLIFTLIITLATTGLWAQETLTLDKALQYAETGSPDLQKTKLNLVRSQKNLEAQRAALKSNFSFAVTPVNFSNTQRFDQRFSQWYTNKSLSTNNTFTISQPILLTDGTISLNNRFSWQESTSDATGTNVTSKTFTNNLYLSLNQPLFTYNRTKLQLKQLELSLENANISYEMQRLNLEKSVTQMFYSVYMAQEDLKIAREELTNTQNNYDFIKNKVNAGLSAQEELYQAELNLATSKSSLQNSEVQLESVKDDIKLTLGMDLFKDIVVLADISLNPVPVNLDTALSCGLRSRMEIRQREIDLQNSLFTMITTKALNEFKGSMDLSYGILGVAEKIGNVFDIPTKSPSVALSFNIPIFDWGEKKARIAAQEAAIKTSEINLDQQKKQITIDIKQVYRNLQNLQNQIEIAKQSEKNAQLTYDINKQRYENGDLTGMDMNLQQTQLSQKKISYSQALINYKIELLNLKIQTLYDFSKNAPVIPSELYSK